MKLAGPGEPEAAIRAPLEQLLRSAGPELGVRAVFHDEVRDTERRVRPDYGVSVDGAITGYVEVKAPGRAIAPAALRGHDKVQWERQQDLPNLLYTNGTEWRLYQDGAHRRTVHFTGDLYDARVSAPAQFETLLADFLTWKPAPITSLSGLVTAIARMTRLLRGEVLDQLTAEHAAVRGGADERLQPFLGLAAEWRAMLFPHASEATFADGYAQTVTFALLLARTDDITVFGESLHTIGEKLRAEHSLMGRALQLLTDDVAVDFRVTLDLLARTVDAVDWRRIRGGGRDTYLHLYEHFLDEYDPELRKRSGSYYTPVEVVEQMVRLTDDVLVTRLGKPRGFADPGVFTVDPAMGTGTYLHAVLERIAANAAAQDGPGAVSGAVTRAAERIAGFELQMGPYAVAELRAAEQLNSYQAVPPNGGLKLFVTDTLDDPNAAETQFRSALQLIAASRRKANEIKAQANVTVVIGNPPYAELANGAGGWVENGGLELKNKKGNKAILDDWIVPGMSRFKAKLKNLYVFFWRWATWKVWESTPADDGNLGVIAFITTSGYLTGPAFEGMRAYLRRYASEGWIIDCTPEGQTPDIPTRIFPGVRQPLAIGIFVRRAGTDNATPAHIRHRLLTGRRADKFAALAATQLDDDGWRDCRTDWTAPLTPASTSQWDTYPALDDLLPWYSPGVFPTRTWVYAPSRSILEHRWSQLIGEGDREQKAALFKESNDAHLKKIKPRLPGEDTSPTAGKSLLQETATKPTTVRVGYRAFDRQWVVADPRVMDRPRQDLWAARQPGQVFVVEQHRHSFQTGPGLTFSELIPDFHHFNGRGGRVLPFLHPDGTPNLTRGLTTALGHCIGTEVTAEDVLAYIAGVVAHPTFTETFTDELTTPGIRIPITADAGLWRRAVDLGCQVLWLHTYGQRFTGEGRPAGDVRLPVGDPQRPLCQKPVTAPPEMLLYVEDRQHIVMGDGEFGPVTREVWDYAVGGRNVIKSWFDYRKKEPGGRRSSPLDDINATAWDPDWTGEFLDLLSVLTRLIALEPQQAETLKSILTTDTLTLDDLAAAGIRWPQTTANRKPRFSLDSAPNDVGDTLL
ncbi:type ISP restriction/modification enzyme [Streptomyces sp. NPDC014940]|uniref:type ISP restriction/modification enzyme n=1 Tax=Streptomyces sp. NPDC014940 TaxID=3364932 RepID=UPI0036FE2561